MTKLSLKDDAVPTIYPRKGPRLISSSTLAEARESTAVVKLNVHISEVFVSIKLNLRLR